MFSQSPVRQADPEWWLSVCLQRHLAQADHTNSPGGTVNHSRLWQALPLSLGFKKYSKQGQASRWSSSLWLYPSKVFFCVASLWHCLLGAGHGHSHIAPLGERVMHMGIFRVPFCKGRCGIPLEARGDSLEVGCNRRLDIAAGEPWSIVRYLWRCSLLWVLRRKAGWLAWLGTTVRLRTKPAVFALTVRRKAQMNCASPHIWVLALH